MKSSIILLIRHPISVILSNLSSTCIYSSTSGARLSRHFPPGKRFDGTRFNAIKFQFKVLNLSPLPRRDEPPGQPTVSSSSESCSVSLIAMPTVIPRDLIDSQRIRQTQLQEPRECHLKGSLALRFAAPLYGPFKAALNVGLLSASPLTP